MGKARDKHLKHLEWLSRNTRVSPQIKHMINEYVDLYRYGKIAQRDTVENAILSLASSNKKIRDKAIIKYETTIEGMRNKPPLNERMETARINNLGTKTDNNNKRLIEEAPSQRAAVKIQRLFANGIAYELSTRHGVNRPTSGGNVFKALKDKVMEITVVPKFVGSKSAYDIAYMLMKACQLLLKQLPAGSNFKFNAVMTFENIGFGPDLSKHSKVYFKKDAARWATEYSEDIYTLAQSGVEMKFKNFEIRFYIAIIPSGGSFVDDETLKDILARKTVIQIKNNDNNCFWYSLAYSINDTRSDRFKYKFIDGKPSGRYIRLR